MFQFTDYCPLYREFTAAPMEKGCLLVHRVMLVFVLFYFVLYSPALPAKRMMSPIVSWDLLHQLAR